LGGDACDPTLHPCILSVEKFKNSAGVSLEERLHAAGLCDACQVFGTTGWKRRFRLMIVDKTEDAPYKNRPSVSGERFKRNGTVHPLWYFKDGGRSGDLEVQITSLSTDFDPRLLLGPLQLIVKYGGLAARNQLGFGWVNSMPAIVLDPTWFRGTIHVKPGRPQPSFPALTNMFFTEITTDDAGILATLNAKYDVRQVFRTAFDNRELRHFICGSIKGNAGRQAAKVFFSQAVEGRMKAWGWIPTEMNFPGVTREDVVSAIYTELGRYGARNYWREFSSPRDTVSANQVDSGAFLASLLQEAV
jgi:CRISPR-associated protein Cmr1